MTQRNSVVEEVAENVYAYLQPDGSWWINNTGFIVGRSGVVAIDTCSTEARTKELLTTIAGITEAPVRTLVNTHHHGDHTHGNHLFTGATVISHERTRQEIIDAGRLPLDAVWPGVEWGSIGPDLGPDPVTLPNLTYTDGVTLHVDDIRAEVRYVGQPAHTTNDSVVWLPEQSVLFTGDLLFNGGTPFLLMGSISGSLTVLEELKGYGARTLVPGHGAVAEGVGLIDSVTAYLRFVQETAAAGKAAGLEPLELARETDLGEFAGLLDAERIVGNLHRAYAELDGREPGARLDTIKIITEMIAYNGGKPLTCHA